MNTDSKQRTIHLPSYMTELGEKNKTGLQRSSHEVIYFPEDTGPASSKCRDRTEKPEHICCLLDPGPERLPELRYHHSSLSSPSQSKRYLYVTACCNVIYLTRVPKASYPMLQASFNEAGNLLHTEEDPIKKKEERKTKAGVWHAYTHSQSQSG